MRRVTEKQDMRKEETSVTHARTKEMARKLSGRKIVHEIRASLGKSKQGYMNYRIFLH